MTSEELLKKFFFDKTKEEYHLGGNVYKAWYDNRETWVAIKMADPKRQESLLKEAKDILKLPENKNIAYYEFMEFWSNCF